MATEKIIQRINQLPVASERQELLAVLNAMIDGIRVVTAKLDADAGVTDTNYTALFDAVIVK